MPRSVSRSAPTLVLLLTLLQVNGFQLGRRPRLLLPSTCISASVEEEEASSLSIPDGIAASGVERHIRIWGCVGDEECAEMGFDEAEVAVLWRDVTDFSSGMETPEQRWQRGRAARSMVHEAKGRVLAVSEEDGHVVASVCFDARDGHIVAVMTEKAARRQRIASLLMASVCQHLRRTGLERAWLEVQDRSPHLIGLYGKLGFTVDKNHGATIDRATVMELDLTKPNRLLDMAMAIPGGEQNENEESGAAKSSFWDWLFPPL